MTSLTFVRAVPAAAIAISLLACQGPEDDLGASTEAALTSAGPARALFCTSASEGGAGECSVGVSVGPQFSLAAPVSGECVFAGQRWNGQRWVEYALVDASCRSAERLTSHEAYAFRFETRDLSPVPAGARLDGLARAHGRARMYYELRGAIHDGGGATCSVNLGGPDPTEPDGATLVSAFEFFVPFDLDVARFDRPIVLRGADGTPRRARLRGKTTSMFDRDQRPTTRWFDVEAELVDPVSGKTFRISNTDRFQTEGHRDFSVPGSYAMTSTTVAWRLEDGRAVDSVMTFCGAEPFTEN